MEREPILGVMQTRKGDGSEVVLADFAKLLIRQGAQVGGLIQQTTPLANGSNQMELIDIRRNERYLISQPRGQNAKGCCLDTFGLCEASAVLRREIQAGVDLLIINKFAVAEAEGKGLLQELFMAIEQNIPVLTSVADRYEAEWQGLTDGLGQKISPTLEAVTAWWDSTARHTHGATD